MVKQFGYRTCHDGQRLGTIYETWIISLVWTIFDVIRLRSHQSRSVRA
jgi:hypothetical protein